MTVRVVHPDELTSADLEAWHGIVAQRDELASPYFRPEFVQAVGAVRPAARVAVWETSGRPVGFLPFHLDQPGVAGPVAGTLTDFQGPILDRDGSLDGDAWLQECNLRAWRFDHLLIGAGQFDSYHEQVAESPYVDLSEGFAAFCEARRQAGSSLIKQVQRKARKIEREVGPLRLELSSSDPTVWDRLLGWKLEQYRRIGCVNHLAPDWTRALLARIGAAQELNFAGLLSALYAGDRLIAAHFGMRSATTVHWWFPTYERELEKYSPGLILLVRLAERCEAEGWGRIDLGKGEERYKASFTSGVTMLAEGEIDRRRAVAIGRRSWRALRRRVRDSALREPLQRAVRRLRAVRQTYEPGQPATNPVNMQSS